MSDPREEPGDGMEPSTVVPGPGGRDPDPKDPGRVDDGRMDEGRVDTARLDTAQPDAAQLDAARPDPDAPVAERAGSQSGEARPDDAVPEQPASGDLPWQHVGAGPDPGSGDSAFAPRLRSEPQDVAATPGYEAAPVPAPEPYRRTGDDLPEVPEPQEPPVVPPQGPHDAVRWRDPEAGRGWRYPDEQDESRTPGHPAADTASAQRREADAESIAPVVSRRRRGVPAVIVVLIAIIALLLGIILGAVAGREYFAPGGPVEIPTSSGYPGQQPPSHAPDSVAGIAASTLDSTVYIEAVGGGGRSSGSGMVLTSDGYIVTNQHVVALASADSGDIWVTFPDGTEERASYVGGTVDYDIAVLDVDRTDLVPLVLGDSDELVVGEVVVAVGAPLGLDGTVTSGIISALNRPVQAGPSDSETSAFLNAIQTDAAINPGNSGGPLVNVAGEVIGINTAIAQAQGQAVGSIGLGFAIPSNQVRRTAEQIIETGRATYPVIGIGLDTGYRGEGVRILEEAQGDLDPIAPGGAGEAAGLEPGDIVLRFDDQPVTSPAELIVAVRSRAPGESVELSVRRGEEEITMSVELGEQVSE